MENQLDRFRKASGKDDYRAFKIADTAQRSLRIRPISRPWERMSYNHLWRILENSSANQIGLVYSFAVVVIKGKNLEPIADAIDQHHCELIQEFDKDMWAEPGDSKSSFIQSIDIFTETRDAMVLATDRFASDAVMARAPREHS